MPQLKRLVFFGTEDFSLPTLQALIKSDFEVIAVVTKPDSARGRSKQLVAPAIKQLALEHNIPVFQPNKLADITDQLSSLKPDAAVLVSYGKILPQRTLDVFEPFGIINIHPSLLPKYRGPAPIEAAILHGDTTTGISIMKLTAGMDEGPIYAQTQLSLDGTERKDNLSQKLAGESARLLIRVLPQILSGELLPIEQKNDDVSYTSIISKSDGICDPLTETATMIERKVRAYIGFPKTRLPLNNTDVIITSVRVTESLLPGALTIKCAENSYLEIKELIAPSGKRISGDAFLRGYAA